MYDSWFVWALIGIVCIGLEMLVPGFVIFFFGMGALLTALTSLIPGIADILWLQILLFIVYSVCSLVFLRKQFKKIFAGTVFDTRRMSDEDIGTGGVAEVLETISPVKDGRIRFRGTTWNARTSGTDTFAPGASVRVISREGLVYVVEPLEAGKSPL